MQPLNQLPFELIDHILRYLLRPDLKAVRLTCHALSDVATRWLYHSVYMRVESFQSNVIRQENEGFQELVSTFAPLVHSIDIDGDEDGCPLEVASFLDQLPAMEKISMRGTRSSWHHDQFFQGDFEMAMLRTSLVAPVENRILVHLKSLTLALHQDEGDWLLSDLGIIFLIPQLEDLTLTHLALHPGDPEFPRPWSSSGLVRYSRQTALKSLSITDSHIDVRALKKILSLPRALSHLQLRSRNPECDDLPDEWQERRCSPDDVVRAIAQQSRSLEKLDIYWDMPVASSKGYAWPRDQFPGLKECEVTFTGVDEEGPRPDPLPYEFIGFLQFWDPEVNEEYPAPRNWAPE